jgi:type IV pilus assembly protein PilO
MTAGGDFIPNDPNLETGPEYPVIFGIPLTPTLSGILLALVGLGGAALILLNLVQPEWQKNQDLETKVRDKEAQVQQQQAIAKQIDDARKELDTAKKQREDVLSLFANEPNLNTLLLDINRQIDARNAGLPKARRDKLAACPAWVRSNVDAVEKAVGDLVVKSQLTKFTPDPKLSGVITDGSYGSLVNNKLKRQVTAVTFEGNFSQTQSILRSIERLQPLLVFKNLEFVVGDGTPGKVSSSRLYEVQGNTVRFLPNCQPEPKITSSFQLEALLPLTPEDTAKAAPPAAAQPVKK